jgi:outer membrane protein assembly factor BamB
MIMIEEDFKKITSCFSHTEIFALAEQYILFSDLCYNNRRFALEERSLPMERIDPVHSPLPLSGTLPAAHGKSSPESAPAITDMVTPADSPAPGEQKCLGAADMAKMILNEGLGTLNELWSIDLGTFITTSPALDAEGTLYVGSHNGKIQAFREGKELWAVEAGGWVGSPVVGKDGTVYAGSGDGKVYAARDGALVWTFPTGGDWVSGTPCAGPDGTVYAGCGQKFENGRLFAIENGRKKWEFEFDNEAYPSSSPTLGPDGTVYVGASDGKLYAIKNGKKRWTFKTGDHVQSKPVVGDEGTVYFGSHDHLLYAVKDGKKVWDYATGGKIFGDPFLGDDGTVYVGSYDHKIHAVKDGKKVWDFETGSDVFARPVMAPDGTLYVGSKDAVLYALKEGKKVGEFKAGGDISSTCALGADGTLYFGCGDQKIRACMKLDSFVMKKKDAISEELAAKRQVESDDEWLSIDGLRLPVNQLGKLSPKVRHRL